MRYFPHIDGLRAVAVLSVIFFHLGFAGTPGGFVGVDIFFAISGFVITHVIRAEFEAGTFSILQFYDRRVRRILPALLIVVVASLAFGYWSLMPGAYKSLGESAAYAAAFLGNIYFLHHTGYFDAAADQMPLLHLWTLSVEEQFYLVWPFVAAALWRLSGFKRGTASAVVAIAALASLLASIAMVSAAFGDPEDPKRAFYLIQFRAWELLLGALLALNHDRLAWLASPRVAALLGVAGFAGIGYGIFGLNADSPFPGLNAIPPCLGAAALIAAGLRGGWIGNRLLTLRPVRYVGLISYSLYLWHWPLLVYYRLYVDRMALSVAEQAALLVASFALATASWLFVERPMRRLVMLPPLRVAGGVGLAAGVAAMGAFVAAAQGFPSRVPERFLPYSSLEVMGRWECPQQLRLGLGTEPLCVFGAPWDQAQTHALIWGDSHAWQLAPLLHDIARDKGVSIVLWRACAAFLDDADVGRTIEDRPRMAWCGKQRVAALNWLKEHANVSLLILAASWRVQPKGLYDAVEGRPARSLKDSHALMRRGLHDLLDQVPASIRAISIIDDLPTFARQPIPCLLRQMAKLLQAPCEATETRLHLDKQFVLERHGPTNAILHELPQYDPRVSVLPFTERMCRDHCLTFVGGEFLYRDDDHIRRNLTPTARRAIIERTKLNEVFSRYPVMSAVQRGR